VQESHKILAHDFQYAYIFFVFHRITCGYTNNYALYFMIFLLSSFSPSLSILAQLFISLIEIHVLIMFFILTWLKREGLKIEV